MKLSHNPGAIKRFRRTPWKFQTTFATPLKNLTPFVAAITTAHEPFASASLTLDTVVVEPRNMLEFLADHSLPPERGHEFPLIAGRHIDPEARHGVDEEGKRHDCRRDQD